MWQKETFLKTATLSVLVWAYLREMKLNNENFKIAPVEPRWCCYGNIDVAILLRIWNFSYVTNMRTHLAALSFYAYFSCLCSIKVAQKFCRTVLLIKGKKTRSVSIYHLSVKRKSFGNPCFSYQVLWALAFSEFKKSVGREYIGREPRRK